jgi:hypothetical protein
MCILYPVSCWSSLPVTCSRLPACYLLLLSSIIIIYYYIPVNRSGAGSMFNHRRWSIHSYTRAPALVPYPDSLNLYFDRRQKEFFGWGGGYDPECRKRGGASMLIPSTSVTSHSRTCWCTGSGCSFYHRIYRIREDLLEQVITKKTK